MKNASGSKFLLCFRPIVDVEQVAESKGGDIGGSKHRALARASMDRKESLRRSMTNSSFPDYPKTSGPILYSTKKNTSQSKRVSDREGDPKVSKRSFSMRRKKSSEITKDFSVNKVLDTQDFRTISGLSSSSSSSSSGSSSLLEPNQERDVKPKNQKIKNMKREARPKNSDKTGVHVILISFAVTVFWGKFYAIIFTSLWLYFLPRRRRTKNSICRPEYVPISTDNKQSRENKKRVIIEGLLERNSQHSSNRWVRGALNI